jgi:predicted amidohydrolase YtcJ
VAASRPSIGAAYAMGLAKETGSIELRKRRDLVVLEKNLFEMPSRQLGKTCAHDAARRRTGLPGL